MGNANGDSTGSSLFDTTIIWWLIWLGTAITFILCPFIGSSNRRKLCAARIRERQWDVDVEMDRESSWYRAAAERYERARAAERDQNSPLTTTQEEEIRQLFLSKELSKYTSTISVDAIKVKADVDSIDSGDTTSDSSGEADIETRGTQPVDFEDDIETGRSQRLNTDDSHDMTQADIETGGTQPVDSEDDIETGRSQRLNTDDSDDMIVEFAQTFQADTFVTVPAAGESVIGKYKTRHVANGCAICLCEFEPGDQVTWAANKECPHVFHNECILNWFLASGRKEQNRRRLHPEQSTGDPLNDVITFPMLCPCCRQQYIEKPKEEVPPPHFSSTPESSSATEDDTPSSLQSSSNSAPALLTATEEAPPASPLSNSTVSDNLNTANA